MSELPQHVLDLLDRAAVREAVVRVATAIDRHDNELLARCFTEDVHCVFQGEDVGPGVDRVIAYMTTNAAPLVIVDFAHMLSNIAVELDGDVAHAEADALSYLITDTGAGTQIRLRGLRYVDQLVRTRDGWRIRDHVHRPIWEQRFPVTVL
ncbi:MAG TPA: nuclear transport factor 2 family protein [Candidatus Dormibacteraeota bacterium]|nr:nuclear transport factor 2 family protein [Candidatus Dormibacteraeota bacterium]